MTDAGSSESQASSRIAGVSHLRFATYLAPNMEPVYRYIAEHVGRALDLSTDLVVGSSFEQFRLGEVDVGFI